jgi:hypothetical protein
MRIGKSFVDEETSNAVETELGRGYRGRRLVSVSGERGEDVRKRMEMWKARVDRAQRMTRELSASNNTVGRLAYQGYHTKEEVLEHNRLLRKLAQVGFTRN